MDLNISEVLEQLKAIESFANKVTETKKLADELAENFARMKESINNAINEAFRDIADQIETLRRNMESMESVQMASTGKSVKLESTPSAPTIPPAEPTPAPQPETKPAQPAAPAAPAAPPKPEPAPAETVIEPPPKPETAPAVEPSPPTETAAAVTPELEVLQQKKEKLKAALTDLRFDYMRGYIPEDEYKAKEAELDSHLEEIDKQIAALKS